MATIVKSYTFLDKITADASEVNRNFDDLFSTINNLNSENMAASFNHPASQVTIVDTASNYTSTEIEAALGEPTLLQKGLHTIHSMPQSTGAMVFFPGNIEIGGRICTISTKLSVSGLSQIDSGATISGLYVLCGQPAAGQEITASDLFLVGQSSITISASYDIDAGGYYYNNKRLIASVYTIGATCQALIESYNPDPPQSHFKKVLSTTEGQGLMFFSVSIGASKTGSHIDVLTRYYDKEQGSYGYNGRIRFCSACASDILFSTAPLHVDYDVFFANSNGGYGNQFKVVRTEELIPYKILVTQSTPFDNPAYGWFTLKPVFNSAGNA